MQGKPEARGADPAAESEASTARLGPCCADQVEKATQHRRQMRCAAVPQHRICSCVLRVMRQRRIRSRVL